MFTARCKLYCKTNSGETQHKSVTQPGVMSLLRKHLKGIKFRGYLISRLEKNYILRVFNFAIQ